MTELIAEELGVTLHPGLPVEEARAVLDQLGLAWKGSWGAGRLTLEAYDELVEHPSRRPVIVYDYPRETSPLAKPHRDDPNLVERFEVIVAGRELANAYSELNDPVEQLERFREEAPGQGGRRRRGQRRRSRLHPGLGVRHAAGRRGWALGIDRLVMVLAEVDSIREVILFPTLRPESALTEDDFPALDDGGVSPDPMTNRPLRARVIGWLTALSGALLVLSTLPRVPERLAAAYRYVPLPLRVSGRVVTMLVGLLLLFLAGQLGPAQAPGLAGGGGAVAVTLVANVARLDRPLSAGLSAANAAALAGQPARLQRPARPADALPVHPVPAPVLRGRVPLRLRVRLRAAQPGRPRRPRWVAPSTPS